jgi:uncharacterized membrane protein
MKTTRMPARGWMVPAGLLLLSIVPAIGGTVRVAELASGAETAANQRFFDMPFPILLHIFAAVPFSMIGAFQFSAEFRRRYRSWHRAAGKVLVGLGLLVAISGLWMTLAYPWANNDGEAVYVMRLLFGSAMFGSIVQGINAIRLRDFNAHGAWMMRGYAIGLGAGTQVFTHLPYFILVGKPDELWRAIMMGAGWVINVIVAEWVIRKQPVRAQHTPRRVSYDSRTVSMLSGSSADLSGR